MSIGSYREKREKAKIERPCEQPWKCNGLGYRGRTRVFVPADQMTFLCLSHKEDLDDTDRTSVINLED